MGSWRAAGREKKTGQKSLCKRRIEQTLGISPPAIEQLGTLSGDCRREVRRQMLDGYSFPSGS